MIVCAPPPRRAENEKKNAVLVMDFLLLVPLNLLYFGTQRAVLYRYDSLHFDYTHSLVVRQTNYFWFNTGEYKYDMKTKWSLHPAE